MSENRLKFIEPIVGEQLSSVEFVQDYVQLHFDGPNLTLFVWPVISFDGTTVRFGDPCYRDELCRRISRNVVEVTSEADNFITIKFDDGSSMSMSLKPEDRTGPEAGYFSVTRYNGQLLDF